MKVLHRGTWQLRLGTWWSRSCCPPKGVDLAATNTDHKNAKQLTPCIVLHKEIAHADAGNNDTDAVQMANKGDDTSSFPQVYTSAVPSVELSRAATCTLRQTAGTCAGTSKCTHQTKCKWDTAPATPVCKNADNSAHAGGACDKATQALCEAHEN